MSDWVRDRDVGKGKVAPDNGTLYCKAVSIKAVVTGTREGWEGDSRRGTNTGPGQEGNWVGNWVGNSVLTWIRDFSSVLMTENHTVDRVMGDPDRGVKQDLGEPGKRNLRLVMSLTLENSWLVTWILRPPVSFTKVEMTNDARFLGPLVFPTRIRSVLTRRSLDLGSIGCLYNYTRS